MKLTQIWIGGILLAVALHAQGSGSTPATVIPTGTGVAKDPNTGNDENWSIVANNISGEPISVPDESRIVFSLANGWGSLPGSSWIAPDSNQSNNTNPQTRPGTCCNGSTTYEYQFLISDPAHEQFNMTLLADDMANVILNGKTIYTATRQLYSSPVSLSITGLFVNGLNTIDVIVSNTTGGPTGLNVSFAPYQLPVSVGTTSAPGKYHLDALVDPVDAASGQFYETETDLSLGGPIPVAFRRFYSSQLSTSGASSALGVNWMSNFDLALSVSGSTAKVLMFSGQVLTFLNTTAGWLLISPQQTVYQLTQSGSNYQLLDPETKFVYTFSGGVLTQISDRRGNTVTITQGSNGPTQVADSLGRAITFTYTGSSLTKLTDQSGRSVIFSYSNGVLASVTDVYNQTTKYTYTGTALMSKRTLPLGNTPTTQAYDGKNRVTSQTDPNNNVTTIAYDNSAGTAVTDPLGNSTHITSNPNGDPSRLTDPKGGMAVVVYDSNGRRVSVTDKLGNKTAYTYEPHTGSIGSITDALGNTTTYNYISQSQNGFTYYVLSGISYPDGTSSSMTYDNTGNLLTLKAKDGSGKTFTYDSKGRVLTITAVNQQTTKFTWNTDSTLATVTDPLGNTRTYSYDSLKRMVSVVDENGGKTGFIWDKSTAGPMRVVSPPGLGGTAVYGDSNRQISTVVPPSGGVATTTYTLSGHIATYTDANSNQTTWSYDVDDRVSAATDGSGVKLSYVYDAIGRVTSVTDANGTRGAYTYTAEGQVASATDGSGGQRSYAYDASGRRVSVTTPANHVYQTGYDKLGYIVSNTNPLGEVETVARDAAGRLTSITMPGSVTTAFQRDALGNIVALTTPNGNTWTYGFDALGRVNKAADPLGQSTSLTYTGNQLTGATFPLGSVSITRNGVNEIIQRKYSDGTTTNFTYDNAGYLATATGYSVTRNKAYQPVTMNGIGIAYDKSNRPAALTYAPGKTITYTYDGGGRLASVSDWSGGKTTFGYDGAGRVTSLTYPNGVTTNYSYDADGEVIQIAAGNLASISLTRDAAEKITGADRSLPIAPTLAPANQQFSYDAAGQLTSAASDAMGRVTSQNGRKYTWNLANQLTGFSDGVNSGTFTYDAFGEMTSSTASGAAENFVYNYVFSAPSLSIVQKGGSDLRYYVYLPNGTLLYSIEAADNSRHFYHFDEMGNTVFLTNDSGAVSDSYAITPYGEINAHVGTAENPFTWQGQFGAIQEGAGLYYLRSRHYDASAARFLSRDPALYSDPRSGEPYVYAAGNPLRYIDPDGTDITLPPNSPLSKTQADASGQQFAELVQATIAQVQSNWLTAALFANQLSGFEELLTDVKKYPDLDWIGYAKQYNIDFSPTLPPNPAPPPSNFTVVQKPNPPLTRGLIPPANASTIVKLNLPTAGVISDNSEGMISQDGNTVISNDGGSVISTDGSGVISNDGGSVISTDGSGLLSEKGNGIISQDGSGLKPLSNN
jgi:RHS repeat-associated protein